MIGKEVLLGNGYADLVAVEPSGRLVVVEMKLSRNPKPGGPSARRSSPTPHTSRA
jgi:hypothetical protein